MWFLFASLISLVAWQQQDVAFDDGGRIESLVLRADGAGAIADATVALWTEDGRVLQTEQSDLSGHYVFSRISLRGRVFATASKLGYVSSSVGSVRPGGSGSAISVTPLTDIRNADIRLAIGASIVGRVIDDGGAPVAGVEVSVSKWSYAHSYPSLVAVRDTQVKTGRQGQFRIFGLPQGRFVLTFARSAATATFDVRTVDGVPIEVPTMYFPSVDSLDKALEIELVAGQEFSSGDTQLRPVKAHPVFGTVTTNGQATEGVSIQLKPLVGGAIRATKTNAFGKFEFVNVPALDYVVNAQDAAGAWAQSTLQSLQLDGLRSLDLALMPEISIKCRVNVDGRPGVPKDFVASLIELDAEGQFSPHDARIASDGTLLFGKLLPGRYRLSVTSKQWIVESIYDRSGDLTDSPIEVGPAEVPELRMDLSSRPARLMGALFDPVGRPMSAHTVVLFGSSSDSWTPASRRIRSARPDQFGAYEFVDLPEGSYRLAVVTDIDDGQWFAPGLLAGLSESAIAVTLTRGQQRVLDLRAER